MSLRTFSFVLMVAAVSSLPAFLAAPPSDPQALAILQQSLIAAGGTRGVATIQDFTATGTITYFSAGQQVQGTATLKVRVPDQYRIDANVPQGTRTHAASHGRVAFKEVTGQVSQIPGDYPIHPAIITFPYPGIARPLSDPAAIVSYIGVVTIGSGPTVRRSHVWPGLSNAVRR